MARNKPKSEKTLAQEQMYIPKPEWNPDKEERPVVLGDPENEESGKPVERIGDIMSKRTGTLMNYEHDGANREGKSTLYDPSLSPDEVIERDMQRHLEVWNLPRVDTNDAEKVQGRFVDYVNICRKYGKRPTIAGFAESLGVTRQTLWYWMTGTFKKPPAVIEVLNRVFASMNAELEDLMLTNKINPVSGIFLLKQAGYRDTQEVIVRAEDNSGKTQQELEQEYLNSIPEVDD